MRPQGSANKNKSFLMKRLQDMYGEDFHPIMKMANNCVVLQTIADDHAKGAITIGETTVGKVEAIDASSSAKNANEAWEKIARYVEPQLKAVELSGEISTRPLLVDLSGGKLTEALEHDDEADS